MLEQFDATINTIYSAAADARRWDEALSSIESLTGSVGAVIGFVPKEAGATGFNLAGRFTEEQCRIYSTTYQPICRRTQYMLANPSTDVICDQMVLSESEMARDPVYDWFGQHGLKYFIGGLLPETRRYQVVWSVQRSPQQGHAQSPEIELFKTLRPHVARAVTLADELGTLRSFERFSSAVLDALPNALFALAADGRLLFANAAARRLLERGDGIVLAGGRLKTRLAAEQPVLDRLIRQALRPGQQGNQCWMLTSREQGGPPYATFVSPLSEADADPLAAAARVLVAVHDDGERRQVDAELLTALYGLTEAEARLASALSGGHSVESAAALLGTKQSTARAHLKAVFRKLGVNRQQDLVRMLAGLSNSLMAP